MGPIQLAHMAVIWFALFTLCLAEATGAAGKTVVCYWQSWSRNMSSPHTYTADDIPVHLCTHVVYSYARLDNRASKLYLGKELDAGTDGYLRFFRLKERNPKVKLLLALGDRYGSDRAAWYEAIHDPPRRYRVVSMLYKLLKEYRFDGVHIDWKNALSNESGGTENGIVKFAWQVRRTFKRSANFTLSCATVLPKGRELQAVIRELVPYVDTFHVSPVAGSAGGISSNGTHASRNGSDTLHTSLSRAAIRDGLQYLFEAGLPYEKIVLEIPFYGLKVPEGSQHSESSDQDILPYYEICDLLRSGVPTKWDKERKSSYLVLDNGGRLYYDDADSVRQKVIFARWAGLGGVAAWLVNMDNQVDLQKRKNDLLKGVIEGMNEDISVEFATKVAETSPTPPREAAGGISLISAEATQSSPVREASSARTSILDTTTEGADTQSDHTSSQHINMVTTQQSSAVTRKHTPAEVDEEAYGITTGEPVFPPLTQTTATTNFQWEVTSTATAAPTNIRSGETMEEVTTEIPDSSPWNNTTTEVAESTNHNTTNEFSPLNEKTATPNFEWETTSTATQAPTHNISSETIEPVTTEITESSSRINSSEVEQSTNYNTTNEFSPLNETTATPHFQWEITGTATEAPTHNISSETIEPVTTEIPDGSSRINTTEVDESNNYNTTDEFSPLNQTTATPNFEWELTSTATEAHTHNRSSETIEPVATEIPDSTPRNSTTTEVAESTNYNTTDEFSPLNKTTATPNFEWEITSTATEAPTHNISSETIEPVTTEIPESSSRNNSTEAAVSTNHNTTNEFSPPNETTAIPNFEWEITSTATEAPKHNISSETIEPVTTELPESSSRINSTEVAESTNYNTTGEFSPLNETTATPNFEWEITSTATDAPTHNISSETIESITTKIPESSSRINSSEVEQSNNYNTTNEFSPLNETTATPHFQWEITSTATEAPTHNISSETIEPVTTEIPDGSSRINTTEVAESNNYNTTDEFSPLNQTTATPNFEWELTSTATEAHTHNRSSETIERVATEIPDSTPRNSTTTEVAESTNYNTTDELSPLNETTATPNFNWELRSTATEAPTHNRSSETMKRVTTEIPESSSRNNTTTEIAESSIYNTTDKFSPFNQTTPTPNFNWEFASTATESPTHNISSETIESVATEIPDSTSRNSTMTDVAESSNYNTTDEFPPLDQTTATSNFEWEVTSTATEAPTNDKVSETMEAVNREIPDSSSRNNTTTEVAESTSYNTTDEFSPLNETTATPSFEWELTSTATEAPTYNRSSETTEPVATEILDRSSRINATEVLESTNYNTTNEFSAFNGTSATRNFDWEFASTATEALTHNISSETIEPVTTEIPDGSSRINTTEVAESNNYNTTDEFSPLNQKTATPNFEWQLTSAGTEASTHPRSMENMEPVSTEMPRTSSHLDTTTEITEVNNYSTTEDASYITPDTWLNVTPAGTSSSTESPIALQSASWTELEKIATPSAKTESTNSRGFVTPSSSSFALVPAEKRCEMGMVGTVAHESDSEFYYHCYHGIALLRKCARGSKFNAARGRCSVQSTDRHDGSAVQASPISHHVVKLLNKVVSGEVTLGKNERVDVNVNMKFNVGGSN